MNSHLCKHVQVIAPSCRSFPEVTWANRCSALYSIYKRIVEAQLTRLAFFVVPPWSHTLELVTDLRLRALYHHGPLSILEGRWAFEHVPEADYLIHLCDGPFALNFCRPGSHALSMSAACTGIVYGVFGGHKESQGGSVKLHSYDYAMELCGSMQVKESVRTNCSLHSDIPSSQPSEIRNPTCLQTCTTPSRKYDPSGEAGNSSRLSSWKRPFYHLQQAQHQAGVCPRRLVLETLAPGFRSTVHLYTEVGHRSSRLV